MRNHEIPLVLDVILSTPWAILEDKLFAIENLLARRINIDAQLTKEEIQARIVGPADVPRAQQVGSVAVIPVFGVISGRMNMMDEISGGTSTDMLKAKIQKAVQDETTSAVVLDMNSPGGSVAGLTELHKVVMQARDLKPIVASVNYMAASAAYWLASAASEIASAPSGNVGSIGVYTVHEDRTAQNAAVGVKYTHISAGKFKTEGNSEEPLTDEATAAMQERVNKFYSMFVNDVAAGRNMDVKQITGAEYGARLLTAKDGKAAGLVDRIETLDETISRLAKKGGAKTSARAEDFGGRDFAIQERFMR